MQNSITEAPVLVMFHRARGAYFDEKRDLKEAESAYLAAIEVASLPENAESAINYYVLPVQKMRIFSAMRTALARLRATSA